MELFNSKGTLNASSQNDALNALFAYFQAQQNSQPSLTATASVNDEAKEALLTKALSSERGRVALAQAMANPIR
jgi:hypothetical protein